MWRGVAYCDAAQAGKVFAFREKASPSHVPGASVDMLPPGGEAGNGSRSAVRREEVDARAVSDLLLAAEALEARGRASWAWYYWSLLLALVGLGYGAAVENGVPLPSLGLAARPGSRWFAEASASEDEEEEDVDDDTEEEDSTVKMPRRPQSSQHPRRLSPQSRFLRRRPFSASLSSVAILAQGHW